MLEKERRKARLRSGLHSGSWNGPNIQIICLISGLFECLDFNHERIQLEEQRWNYRYYQRTISHNLFSGFDLFEIVKNAVPIVDYQINSQSNLQCYFPNYYNLRSRVFQQGGTSRGKRRLYRNSQSKLTVREK